MQTLKKTAAQIAAEREINRNNDGTFGRKNSHEGPMLAASHVPDKYAMLQLKRIGYGEAVIESCGAELASALNVGRQFDDEHVQKVAAEIFERRFRRPADSYLYVRNSMGNDVVGQAHVDRMLTDVELTQVPSQLAAESRRFAARKSVNVSDPRVQQGDQSIQSVEHQGMVYHKVGSNTAFPDGQVEGVRIQAGRPITDKEIEEMAALVKYESKASLHATGTMSVPFRDSPNSFIMRNVPQVETLEDGSLNIKQELAPRSAGKLKNFAETLPRSMEAGSSYVRKDGTRALQGVEGGLPDGFSVFMSVTPKKL